jgi:hypothetical protein
MCPFHAMSCISKETPDITVCWIDRVQLPKLATYSSMYCLNDRLPCNTSKTQHIAMFWFEKLTNFLICCSDAQCLGNFFKFGKGLENTFCLLILEKWTSFSVREVEAIQEEVFSRAFGLLYEWCKCCTKMGRDWCLMILINILYLLCVFMVSVLYAA